MANKESNFIKNRLYSFYLKNQKNFIGKAMKFGKEVLFSLAGKKFVGTKDDLKYIKPGKGIFDKTKRIAIELSNICNYAHIHQRCPLSKVKDYKILPARIVDHILETCARYDYKGYIAFDIYNEPGIDPRLMLFIRKTKKMLPDSKIILQTNGFYLNQTLAKEYEESGVDIIRVSAYTPNDEQRLSAIKLDIPFIVTPIKLDNRLEKYDQKIIESKKPCYAPLNELLITCEGRISLCCKEWKREYTFGDLNKQSLEEILTDQNIRTTYDRLSRGDRFLDICQRCTESR